MFGAGTTRAVAALKDAPTQQASSAATKPATPGTLSNYGPASASVPFVHLYAFAAKCNALPCHIRLIETASVSGRSLPALGYHSGPEITMSSNAPLGKTYAVWFDHSDIDPNLLADEVKEHGSVTLGVRATLTDSHGASISATRVIELTPQKAKKPPKPVSLQCQQARLNLLNAKKKLLYVIATGGDVEQAQLNVQKAKSKVKIDCRAN
jgi:hypothetical protein